MNKITLEQWISEIEKSKYMNDEKIQLLNFLKNISNGIITWKEERFVEQVMKDLCEDYNNSGQDEILQKIRILEEYFEYIEDYDYTEKYYDKESECMSWRTVSVWSYHKKN